MQCMGSRDIAYDGSYDITHGPFATSFTLMVTHILNWIRDAKNCIRKRSSGGRSFSHR